MCGDCAPGDGGGQARPPGGGSSPAAADAAGDPRGNGVTGRGNPGHRGGTDGDAGEARRGGMSRCCPARSVTVPQGDPPTWSGTAFRLVPCALLAAMRPGSASSPRAVPRCAVRSGAVPAGVPESASCPSTAEVRPPACGVRSAVRTVAIGPSQEQNEPRAAMSRHRREHDPDGAAGRRPRDRRRRGRRVYRIEARPQGLSFGSGRHREPGPSERPALRPRAPAQAARGASAAPPCGSLASSSSVKSRSHRGRMLLRS